MNKKLSFITLTLLGVTLILSGCGKTDSSINTNQQNAEKPKTTILSNTAKELSATESYKPYLTIHDVKISDYKSSDPETSFITGHVKNNGTKTIKNLQITIYYLDSNDKPISEEKVHALLESENSYSDPIKPNYDSKFVAKVSDGVHKSWGHKVLVEISDIKLVD